ncbi:DUF1645 domain-containing protein [Cephalotus follicularis]|uniref:DUF1645 domain-containing protein n=1 Tax=Cephalotus follicularis TaxID=3775 RepID=A0A1Q3B7M8_CEPFO|nr:DUF1645 domain-containing protein [Cephalotus follicularis]
MSVSPSLRSYSSCNLAEIAARVVQEFRLESEISKEENIFLWDTSPHHQILLQEDHYNDHYNYNNNNNNKINEEDEDEDEEFEFAFVCKEPETCPISADEIFCNGQIKPTYPIFDTNLLQNTTKKSSRPPLRQLFSEDRETTTTTTPSCSSSEADELDGLNPGTYCVWTPKKAEEESPGRCKKSNSTGSSSKRWKFRDLLHRSHSDGKDRFVFLEPRKKSEEKVNNNNNNKGVEDHYVRTRAIKKGDNKRSFLPYKQDLMGFFSNVNGMSKNLHPF